MPQLPALPLSRLHLSRVRRRSFSHELLVACACDARGRPRVHMRSDLPRVPGTRRTLAHTEKQTMKKYRVWHRYPEAAAWLPASDLIWGRREAFTIQKFLRELGLLVVVLPAMRKAPKVIGGAP